MPATAAVSDNNPTATTQANASFASANPNVFSGSQTTPSFNTLSSQNMSGSQPVTVPPPVQPTGNPNGMVAGAAATSGNVNDYINALTPAPSQADQLNQSILDSIANLTGEEGQKGSDQAAAEQAAGIPQLNKNVQDLNNELVTKTAQYNAQFANLGGNGQTETSAVLAAQQSGLQRAHAADVGLTTAQLQAAQGNLKLAQDTVNRAIDLKYSTIEANIATQKAQLDALAPILSKEEKTQADAQAQMLKDQADKVAQQKADETQKQTYALQAATNGANQGIIQAITNAANPQIALQLATPYLAKAPTQVVEVNGHSLLIDSQTGKTVQDLGVANSVIQARIAHAGSGTGTGTSSVTGVNGQQVNVPNDVAPYVQTSSSGVGWVDASSLQGTAAEKSAIVNHAQAAGLKVITNKNTAADLANISDANNKLDTISSVMANLTQPNWLARDLGGIGLTKLAALAETDPQKAAAGTLQTVGLDMLKAISGVQGFRGNATVVQQVNDHLPKITDTQAVAQQKIDYIRQLISDRENGILGVKNTDTNGTSIPQSDGTVWHKNPDGSYTRIK